MSEPVKRKRFRIPRFLFFTFVLFIAVGIVYERVGSWRDARRFPQVGRSVDVGGRALNIYCSGGGQPTVVLESGLWGYRWLIVQREIAKFTRACWYDPAGFGWSEPGSYPNHSDSVARDLHNLLGGARVPAPYVLVGWSLGSFHVRVFRGFYPSEVVGLVLLDPMNEDVTIHIHNHNEAFRKTVILIESALGAVGLFLFQRPDPSPPSGGFSEEEWATLAALSAQAKSRVAQTKELPFWVNGEMARAAGGFGDIPLEVLSAGIQDQQEDAKLDADNALKLALHRKLAGFSKKGTQIIVQNSGHDIAMDAPGAVVEAVRQVVSEVRESAEAGRSPVVR